MVGQQRECASCLRDVHLKRDKMVKFTLCLCYTIQKHCCKKEKGVSRPWEVSCHLGSMGNRQSKMPVARILRQPMDWLCDEQLRPPGQQPALICPPWKTHCELIPPAFKSTPGDPWHGGAKAICLCSVLSEFQADRNHEIRNDCGCFEPLKGLG